ncbi:MAG: hypothetical protein KDB27_28055 [Planctomycetales bacterium]|nr:hypothetical protein [Planctomycetales bacterium]
MAPLHTIEVRWFPSERPFEVSRYFSAEHEAPERTDWYAVPSHDGSGVKIREGRLETKLRSSVVGRHEFGDATTGLIETWSKWSVELAADDAPSELILESAGWLAVAKQRYVRRFEVRASEIWETLDRPLNGCSFELTKLTVYDRVYWTTGFEAVAFPSSDGSDDQLARNLHRIFERINSETTLPRLTLGDSKGYPAWLNSPAINCIRRT